jgi:hypothetical protein
LAGFQVTLIGRFWVTAEAEAWIHDALAKAEQVVEGHGRRLVAHQRHRIRRRERLLRVVFEETEHKYVVITAYLTSDIKRYWKEPTP